MKRLLAVGLSVMLSVVCLTAFSGCNKVKDIQNFDVGAVAQDIGKRVTDGFNNIKDSTVGYINSEIEKFMTEHNIPKDKAHDVLKIAKDWAKKALTASGEVDKARGSLKQYLSDHLDEIDIEVSDTSSK